MGRIEKTVFISYRHDNVPWALAIYQNLTMHGYDVFFDYQSIDSGNFEKVILENIKARAHFLVILTPSAVERCKEPEDWLRREIEMAIDEKRNIVPLMLEGFDFDSPLVKEVLINKLATLRSSNGLRVYAEYFFEGMDKLRQRYLNVTLSDIALHPLSAEIKETTDAKKAVTSKLAPVETNALTKQENYEFNYSLNRLRIPIIGVIQAGVQIPLPTGLDFGSFSPEDSVDIAVSLFPSNERSMDLFALKVQGESMIDAMVHNGDIIILKAAQEAHNGDMAAVWLPDRNETTLKFLFKEKDKYRLQPANPSMKPIYIDQNESLEIKGKVVMVIRKV
jgi:SOS-response transcriptional repressor LexA